MEDTVLSIIRDEHEEIAALMNDIERATDSRLKKTTL